MAKPIRVGILDDLSDGPPGITRMDPWLRYALDELIGAGRIDRDVEFVHAYGLGLPTGTAAGVERAFASLVEQDVLVIVGPAIGHNALLATPLADRYRMPTVNWAGAERSRSEYMFQMQVGSHEDESVVLARHLAGKGVKRIGVVYDSSPIGTRQLQYLLSEGAVVGLDVAAISAISPIAEDATAQCARIIDAGADALVYLGLGFAAFGVARALNARKWGGLKVMNASGIQGHHADNARALDGCLYLDVYSDRNKMLAALMKRPGVPAATAYRSATGYDLGRLLAEGIARASELSCDGVREGLELVKWLPAAEGEEGTLLGFGRYDRGALHGRYLVVRRWENGKSIEVT